MAKILVSLVSDQTIPNLQLIKEFQDIDKYLFISTDGMEKKGVRLNIIKALDLKEEKLLEPLLVNHVSFIDIEDALKKSEFINDDDKYIVNITGGTKIMAMVCHDYFKELDSEIYYVTNSGEKIKLSPGKSKKETPLDASITLDEYLVSYGFSIESKGELLKDANATETIFEYFYKGLSDEDFLILDELRNFRNKKNTSLDKVTGLKDFLERLKFKPTNNEKLSKHEVKYLTGEWFEEFVLNRLRRVYKFEDTQIGVGYQLKKKEVTNEFDVLFVYKNKLYTIECKTYIYEKKEMKKTLLGDVLYKSDSLQSEFGLYPKTIVATLSPLKDDDGTVSEKLKSHIKRAKMKRIDLFGYSDFADFDETLRQLLNIK